MFRAIRIEFPDALYHVTTRGDWREYIYEDDNERCVFLSKLEQVEACHNFATAIP